MYRDPEKQRKAQAEYAARRRAKEPERVKALKKNAERKSVIRNRQIVIEFKSSGCIHCGEKRIPALDCHHVRGEKLFEIGKRPTISESRLREELEKCEVWCANCHRCEHNSS